MVPILALISTLLVATPARAAANQRAELVDQVYRVPAGDWRYIDLVLRQLPVTVESEYEAQAGASDVRLLLMHRYELRNLRAQNERGMVSTSRGEHGTLNHQVRAPGHYVLVVDNRDGDREAPVHLRVVLNFGATVTYLSPERRLIVVLVSFAVFFGIVTWSAKKLLGAPGWSRTQPGPPDV